jgi:hypothetical protein
MPGRLPVYKLADIPRENQLHEGRMTYIPHIGNRLSSNFHHYSDGRYAACGTPRRLST